MIEQTCELLGDGTLHRALRAVLCSTPLPKPADHRGGPATDMFVVTLRLDEVVSVEAAVARAVCAGGTTTSTRQRGLGGFVEAWAEYRRRLELDAADESSSANDHGSAGAVAKEINNQFIGEVR